jgi:ABC-type uncharacterized transport system permease subunit
MDRLNELPLWWLYIALVAVGAIGGGLCAAIDLLIRAVAGRRR